MISTSSGVMKVAKGKAMGLSHDAYMTANRAAEALEETPVRRRKVT